MHEIALVYNADGDFSGYSILKGNKLASTNLWSEGDLADLQAQVARLNESVNIKQYWPNTRDPEVQALLNDPNFMPYDTVMERVVDDANSYLVYDETQETENGAPVLDLERSVLAYKDKEVAKNPTEVSVRFKRAHEIVARRRAGLDDGDELQWTNG